MRNFRFSWFIGGGLVLLLLVGLFFDVWRSYSVRKSLEIDVRRVTADCAKFLPFRPKEAVEYGVAALKARGIQPDAGSVVVSSDGYSVKISVISEIRAYFAWIVGNTMMRFQAVSQADVVLVGSAPVDEIGDKEATFAIASYDDFQLRANISLSPSGDSTVPDYAVKAWRLAPATSYKVGDTVQLQPIRNFDYLKEYASPSLMTVVIVDSIQGDRARVRGFAALNFEHVGGEGQVAGQFVRAQAQGAPTAFLSAEHDFGYVRGGTPKVTLK